MIKKYSLILLISVSFTQDIIEKDIALFIDSINNRTLDLAIEKDNVDSNAQLSVLNDKIYFCLLYTSPSPRD